jgi:hypothetical protein
MSENASIERTPWSKGKKISSIFIFTYLFLFMFPEPFKDIPGVSEMLKLVMTPMEWLILWFGKSVLNIQTLEKIEVTGSGDTTFDYVRIMVLLILSTLITIVILIFSKRKEYQNWFQFTWVYARYYLGLFLIIYGFVKLFEGQFPSPYLGRLEQNYGDSSPMGLMWTFMGASKPYTFFAGMMEFIAGCLLLFRRTTIAGGMMAFGVMLNVAVMNYCYDVSVKLFSTHLVLIAVFVVSPHLKSLFDFIFLQKTTQLKVEPLHFQKKWQRVTRKSVKIGLFVLCAAMLTLTYFEGYSREENNDYSKVFNGSYKIISYIKKNDSLPIVKTDTLQWSKILMEDGYFSAKTITERRIRFEVKTDTIAKKITITSVDDSTKIYQFKYQLLPKKIVVFKGKFEGDSLEITTVHKKIKEYRLNSTPFKWINEYPYNR